MTRVWNVSNDPTTSVTPRSLVVLGRLLKPGQSVEVSEDLLAGAHKLKHDVESKLLAISKETPTYLARAKAVLPATAVRAHGKVSDAMVNASSRVDEVLTYVESPAVRQEEEFEEPSEETSESSEYKEEKKSTGRSSWKSKKGR